MIDSAELLARLGAAMLASSAECLTPAELDEELAGSLARWIDQGLIEAWDREEGPAVTLTPLGAERLSLALGDDGHWVDRAQLDKPVPRPRERDGAPVGLLDSPDLRPEPPEAKRIRLEELAALRERERYQRAPSPTILLGLSLSPFPVRKRGDRTRCPACAGAELGERTYCLVCDRWGLDPYFSAKSSRKRSCRRRDPDASPHSP